MSTSMKLPIEMHPKYALWLRKNRAKIRRMKKMADEDKADIDPASAVLLMQAIYEYQVSHGGDGCPDYLLEEYMLKVIEQC